MWWLILLVIIVGALVLTRRSGSAPPVAPAKSRPPASPPESLAQIEARMRREVEAEAARLMPQIEADAAKIAEMTREAGLRDAPASPKPSGVRGPGARPSWMSAEEWDDRLLAYRRQGRSEADIAEVARHLEQRGPWKPRSERNPSVIYREDYVPKEDEARYLTRDADGLPTLRLVDAGDRLAIWSPIDSGGLINPKGPGLRGLGLCSSYARGAAYHASTYRTADLRKGRWVELKREPDNPHDQNAVAMYAPGARKVFAYVQRGRAAAVARRMDAGEDMAGVSMRGPGRGRDDDTAFILIGSRADLTAMLDT